MAIASVGVETGHRLVAQEFILAGSSAVAQRNHLADARLVRGSWAGLMENAPASQKPSGERGRRIAEALVPGRLVQACRRMTGRIPIQHCPGMISHSRDAETIPHDSSLSGME